MFFILPEKFQGLNFRAVKNEQNRQGIRLCMAGPAIKKPVMMFYHYRLVSGF